MAFKLTKTEETQFEKLKTELTEKYGEVETAVKDYNEDTEKLKNAVETALAQYNESLGEFRTFVDGIGSGRRDEFDDKSDTWKESDTGSSADEWVSTWENADLEDVNINFPDQLELEFDNHADEELPIEA